MTVTFVIFFVC